MGKLLSNFLKEVKKRNATPNKGFFVVLSNVTKDIDSFYDDCEEICLHLAEFSAQEEPTVILGQKVAQPKIGACLFVNKKLYCSSRSGRREGDHAEFTIIEEARKANEDLTNAILFTSLEPCTKHSRSQWSTSCSEYIIQTNIPEVHIGCLDANPAITGLGTARLLDKCKVVFFKHENVAEAERINKNFFDSFKTVIDGKTMKDILSCIKDKLDDFAVRLYLYPTIDINSDYELTSDDWYHFFLDMIQNHSIVNGKIMKYDVTPDFALAFYKDPSLVVPNFKITIYDERKQKPATEPKRFETTSIISMIANIKNDKSNIFSYIYAKLLLKQLKYKKFDEFAKNLFKTNDLNGNIGRELLVNAIAHSDFSKGRGGIDLAVKDDKLIVYNPVINDDVAYELRTVPLFSLPQNPRLMTFLYKAGLVEMEHRGMNELDKELQNGGVTFDPEKRFGIDYLKTTLPINTK